MLKLTTSARSKNRTTHGFSLAELLVAISITMLLSLSVITFYVTFAKATLTMSNYSQYDTAAGKLTQIFSRDVREAESITWTHNYQFTLVKKGVNYTYKYDAAEQEVTRQETGQTAVTLATDISSLSFKAYDQLGVEIPQGISFTPLNNNTKMLQIVGKFSGRTNTGSLTTSDIITARYILRNKEI